MVVDSLNVGKVSEGISGREWMVERPAVLLGRVFEFVKVIASSIGYGGSLRAAESQSVGNRQTVGHLRLVCKLN